MSLTELKRNLIEWAIVLESVENEALHAPGKVCREAHGQLEAMQAEIDRLRAWRDETSLALSDLREDAERSRKSLKLARGWLNMVASERPETSDIHAVLAEVDASLETRSEK